MNTGCPECPQGRSRHPKCTKKVALDIYMLTILNIFWKRLDGHNLKVFPNMFENTYESKLTELPKRKITITFFCIVPSMI